MIQTEKKVFTLSPQRSYDSEEKPFHTEIKGFFFSLSLVLFLFIFFSSVERQQVHEKHSFLSVLPDTRVCTRTGLNGLTRLFFLPQSLTPALSAVQESHRGEDGQTG